VRSGWVVEGLEADARSLPFDDGVKLRLFECDLEVPVSLSVPVLVS
jgi:hypothetical protein